MTVTATAKDGWSVTSYDPPDLDGDSTNDYQRHLTEGANTITVRVTEEDGSPTRNYTITVTQTTTPGAPTSLRADPNHDIGGLVELSWTRPSSDGGRDITHYSYRSKNKEEGDDDGVWDGADTWTRGPDRDGDATRYDFNVTGLTDGITYIFQVRAENANGPGFESRTAEATPAGPLPAPQDLVVPTEDGVGNRRVKLEWTHVANLSVSGYKYRQREAGGSWGGWRPIADRDLVESGNTRSYTVTGLTNGRTYSFQVLARNDAGDGAPSGRVDATPVVGRPGAPMNPSATAGDGEVALSWTAPSDNGGEPITEYQYRYDDEPLTDAADDDWIGTGGTGTTVTVHGLMNGMTYYFRVRAVNDLGCTQGEMEGCGQESLEVSAKPFGKPVTEVNLKAESDKDSRVELTWTTDPAMPPDTDELSGFQYRQKAGGGYGSWIDIRNSDANTVRHFVTGLMNGTTYTFQVRAVNSSGGGDASDEESAVPSIPPGAPTNLTATAGDEEVRLTWTPPRTMAAGASSGTNAKGGPAPALHAMRRRQIARRVRDVPHPH